MQKAPIIRTIMAAAILILATTTTMAATHEESSTSTVDSEEGVDVNLSPLLFSEDILSYGDLMVEKQSTPTAMAVEPDQAELATTVEEAPATLVAAGVSIPPGDQTPLVLAMLQSIGLTPETLAYYFPKGLDPVLDIYLGWKNTYPQGYANLMKWGKAFLMGDVANYPPLDLDPAMHLACFIAYEGARWDAWIQFRGCYGSPFVGKGTEMARYLYGRGRSVANCLATLEVESTFGLGGSCYYGILYGSYSNTVQGYCALLDDHGVSNDPWEQACFWNMPGYPTYQQGFTRCANTIKNWWP